VAWNVGSVLGLALAAHRQDDFMDGGALMPMTCETCRQRVGPLEVCLDCGLCTTCCECDVPDAEFDDVSDVPPADYVDAEDES
jgi:hypothetical protein